MGDKLADQFLKKSEDRSTESVIFMGIGLAAGSAAVVDGVSRYSISGTTGVQPNYGFDVILLVGAVAVGVIGQTIEAQSNIDKFDAVKRYNAVKRGDETLLLSYVPDQQGMVLGWAKGF
jgi:hypothetical protein